MIVINRRQSLELIGGVLACSALGTSVRAETKDMPETFSGALDTGAGQLRLQLVLEGSAKATLYSLDQGNAAIPATAIVVKGDHLQIAFAIINARYDAKRQGDVLDGTFTQMGKDMPLRLVRGGAIAADPLDKIIAGPLTPPMLAAARAHFGTPAIGAMWQKGKTPPHLLVDGLRAADRSEKVTVADRWHVGSITKSMTATLAARAVEAGLIGWDARVGDVLGAVAPDMNAAYRDVTLTDLLCHHAGLQANIDDSLFNSFSAETGPAIIAERQRWARLALQQVPFAPPRSKFNYSNNGFLLAGAMLETKTGKSWETLIADMLFKPLGMQDAGFGPPDRGHLGAQPRGHDVRGGGTRIALSLDNPAALGPAGRAAMSLASLATYLAAHRDRPQAFLKPASWDVLHEPRYGGPYALGWFVGQDGSLWHNGSNGAWYAEVLVDRAAGIDAAIVSNDAKMSGAQPGRLLKAAYAAARAERS